MFQIRGPFKAFKRSLRNFCKRTNLWYLENPHSLCVQCQCPKLLLLFLDLKYCQRQVQSQCSKLLLLFLNLWPHAPYEYDHVSQPCQCLKTCRIAKSKYELSSWTNHGSSRRTTEARMSQSASALQRILASLGTLSHLFSPNPQKLEEHPSYRSPQSVRP